MKANPTLVHPVIIYQTSLMGLNIMMIVVWLMRLDILIVQQTLLYVVYILLKETQNKICVSLFNILWCQILISLTELPWYQYIWQNKVLHVHPDVQTTLKNVEGAQHMCSQTINVSDKEQESSALEMSCFTNTIIISTRSESHCPSYLILPN